MKSFLERTARSAGSNATETSKNAASATSVPIQMNMPEPEKDLVAQNKSVAQKAEIDEEQEPVLKKAFQLQSGTTQLAGLDEEKEPVLKKSFQLKSDTNQLTETNEEKEPILKKSLQLKSEITQLADINEEKEPVLTKPFQLKSDTAQLAENDEEKEPILKKNFQLKSDTAQLACEEEEPVLKKQSGAQTLQTKTNSTGMPDNLKIGVESLSGYSMDDVKVHYNSPKPASLQAYAYAQGTNIHIGPGQEKHLPHEAWHMAQQKQGRVQPTMQMKEGVPVNDDKGLEHEADVMGERANVGKLHMGRYPLKPAFSTAPPQSATMQRQITDEAIKLKIKAKYKGVDMDPIVLNLLLKDAFDKTDNFEDAVARIDWGLKRENAVFTPPDDTTLTTDTTPDSRKRPAINTDKATLNGDFKSGVPKIKTDESTILSEWGGLMNTENFYEKVRASLTIARDPSHQDHTKEQNKLDKLINAYGQHQDVKKLIDTYVRVKAKKAKNASTGTGLDELLKTSETMKYLELSYRPPQEMSAVAKFKGKEFDWMDVQQQLRLSTEFIVWAGDLVNEISGHTGTFQKEYKLQWMTTKQDLMHSVRDDAISKRSNPATALVEALGTHLRITENVAGFESEIYKGPESEKALIPSGYSVKDKYSDIKEQLGKHRDMLKTYIEFFREEAEPPTPSSPMQSRHGTEDTYYPESPKQYDDELEINETAGKVEGNPLPNLATQWRYLHVDKPKTIPAKPINPAIKSAREEIKKILGTSTATSINSAAKRQVKKLSEEADVNEKDQTMILVYLEKLKLYKEKKGVAEIIKALETALLELG